jgi:hypothetical protein
MSKKKTNPKKHKFKHAESAPSSPSMTPMAATSAKLAAPRLANAVASTRDFSYVAKDVRRIGFMVGGLIAIELVFYYLLVFTPIGAAVYQFVNV